MNIFEHMQKLDDRMTITTDEAGNRYLSDCRYDFWTNAEYGCWQESAADPEDSVFFLTKEEFEKMSEIEILIHDEEADSSYLRRPYYRMRGCPVSEEQAFDIISRCDRYLGFSDEISRGSDLYVGSGHFQINTMWPSIYPRCVSIIAPDGRVGVNSITFKYPEMSEMIDELYNLVFHFPYLDFVIAMSNTDDFWWENSRREKGLSIKQIDEKFYKIIEYGIHVHDKKIEIVGKKEAIKLYKEYEKKCCFSSEHYDSDYYEDRNQFAADPEYVRRCAERYNIDVENFMEDYLRGLKNRI